MLGQPVLSVYEAHGSKSVIASVLQAARIIENSGVNWPLIYVPPQLFGRDSSSLDADPAAAPDASAVLRSGREQ